MLTIVAYAPPGRPMFALLFATAAVTTTLGAGIGVVWLTRGVKIGPDTLGPVVVLASCAVMTLWFAVQ